MKIVAEIDRERISTLLREGKRVDGRGFDDIRPIKLTQDVISKAEGSSEVWLGSRRRSDRHWSRLRRGPRLESR